LQPRGHCLYRVPGLRRIHSRFLWYEPDCRHHALPERRPEPGRIIKGRTSRRLLAVGRRVRATLTVVFFLTFTIQELSSGALLWRRTSGDASDSLVVPWHFGQEPEMFVKEP